MHCHFISFYKLSFSQQNIRFREHVCIECYTSLSKKSSSVSSCRCHLKPYLLSGYFSFLFSLYLSTCFHFYSFSKFQFLHFVHVVMFCCCKVMYMNSCAHVPGESLSISSIPFGCVSLQPMFF